MPKEASYLSQFLAPFEVKARRAGGGSASAVVTPARGELCVATDSILPEVHFVRPGFSWADIGHRALALPLADLASMGATPSWFLCAVAAPPTLRITDVRRLAQGMAELAKRHGLTPEGAAFTPARELSLTLTVAGSVPAGKALRRSGARAGDLLYVSGTLGDARLGLAFLRGELPEKLTRKRVLAGRGRTSSGKALQVLQPQLPFDPEVPQRERPLPSPLGVELSPDRPLRRQLRPEPRLGLGQLARRFATAAADVTDGLSRAATQLARASAVRVELNLADLPTSTALRAVQSLWPVSRTWPWTGGHDHELILSVPPDRAEAFERACRREGHRVTRVGQVARGRGVNAVDPLA